MEIREIVEDRAALFTQTQLNRLKEVQAYTWIRHTLGAQVFRVEDGAKSIALWAKSLTEDEEEKELIGQQAVEYLRACVYVDKAPKWEEEIFAAIYMGMGIRHVMRIFKKSYSTIKAVLEICDIPGASVAGSNFADVVSKHFQTVMNSDFIKS